MFTSHIVSRFRSLILVILGIFRRALCCFSRRRKSSVTDFEQLSSVNVINDRPSHKRNVQTERDWNSWDDTPRTVEEHIEHYREKMVKPPTPPAQSDNLDFFNDMAPKIIKQKKVLINTNSTEEQNTGSRLAAVPDIPLRNVWDDLEDDDNNQEGWNELDDDSTKRLLREKRKELRAQQKTAKQTNSPSTAFLAEKLSTRYS